MEKETTFLKKGKSKTNRKISEFIELNYRHFNALALKNAARAFKKHIDDGGIMFLAMAGAMSTAELGISLAEMIRKNKIHAISCTGANLEEDLFNLIGNNDYIILPDYRDLTSQDEKRILDKKYSRVTDTCIPEDVMYKVQDKIFERWKKAEEKGERKFPHEFLYEAIIEGDFEKEYQINPSNSWLVAAAEKNIPVFVPGWEDSTLGNVFAAHCIKKEISPSVIKSGLEYMMSLSQWYLENVRRNNQIGGGIAGDFAICVVPMLNYDLKKNVKTWSYFCQISDSITSFGSYSGAIPNEKITWGKLDTDTPRFVIESDATIVAPLIFNYVIEG
ncbi:MAG: deoxyhypusine synthase family protein [Elusimicrobiota bacterium]